MSDNKRAEIISELEQVRGSCLICYVTSTRANLDARMAMDVIPVIYRHLRAIQTEPKDTTIDLFIHSNGGEGVVPWRLVSLVREFCSTFNVLVPHLAYSAATLTALGADSVVMHPMGVLGPTDPTVSNAFNPSDDRNPAGPPLGIAVEDVTSYFELVRDDVGIRHEDELVQALTALTNRIHPLALGNVKRSTLQSRMLGKSLLHARTSREHVLTDQQIVEVVERLTSQLYYHGHPISRTEAREEIGLPFVVNASKSEETLMWDLYESFDREMKLSTPFNIVSEALAVLPTQQQQVFAIPQQQGLGPGMVVQAASPSEVKLENLVLASVESTRRRDVFRQDLMVSLIKQPVGGYQAVAVPMEAGWFEVDSSAATHVEGSEMVISEVTDESSAGTVV